MDSDLCKQYYSSSAVRERRSTGEYVKRHGFWYTDSELEGIENMQKHFRAREDDIILTSSIKTGTTWMKALIFSIINHNNHPVDDPLRQFNPHDLMPTLEFYHNNNIFLSDVISQMPSPRLLHTHMPYTALPQSIKDSKCRIVYVARNPKDTFVSLWHFYDSIEGISQGSGLDNPSKEDVFDAFCSGVFHYGPFFEHVLSYWHPSRIQPNIMFLTYEDLQADCTCYVKKLADFLGRSCLRENDDEIEEIVKKCSFQSLSNMDVNKRGEIRIPVANIRNSFFFRKGAVGDWKNHFTPHMNDRLDALIRHKLHYSGLHFKYELSDPENDHMRPCSSKIFNPEMIRNSSLNGYPEINSIKAQLGI